jgi:hypothetical protein
MFIASTANPASTSGNDVPVIVLTYGEESYLVKLPFAYEVRILFLACDVFFGGSTIDHGILYRI